MKKLRPALVFSFLGVATFASLVGTVSGTLAWYAYNTRTSISYSGTSVENSVQLQIGLASDTPINIDNDSWNNTMSDPELVDGKYCYFAPLGYGLDSGVINAYLSAKGYATNELSPVTSGYYDPADTLSSFGLYSSPTIQTPNSKDAADAANYLKLPFILRASKSKTDTGDYVANQEIWLTDAKGAASSDHDGNVYKAMRVFFDRKDADYDSDFILNPDADADGQTKVGGLLDLSDDLFYDFNESGEIFYGEWDETQLANPASLLSENGFVPPEAPNPNPFYDLNGTGNIVDSANTFNARHHAGTKYYSYEALNNIPIKTAKYQSLESIKPNRNSVNGQLTNKDVDHPSSVCKTGGSEVNYIGFVDAYIWLEGWDFAVVNEEQFHAFDFGLTFEINKVSS